MKKSGIELLLEYKRWIKERENYERQRQHLPLHYRTYVTEFQ